MQHSLPPSGLLHVIRIIIKKRSNGRDAAIAMCIRMTRSSYDHKLSPVLRKVVKKNNIIFEAIRIYF
jgi:hypothetical protein